MAPLLSDLQTVFLNSYYYGDIVKEKMNGGNPEYMLKLTFEQEPMAPPDPDKTTTGLRKEDVMNMLKNKG